MIIYDISTQQMLGFYFLFPARYTPNRIIIDHETDCRMMQHFPYYRYPENMVVPIIDIQF